jgi:large subunit ribosomal protein L17
MRHQVKKGYLRRNSSHRRALLRNLVTSFVEKDRITTTVAKAKNAKPIAEKMITLAKRNTLHSRRQALSYLTTEAAVKRLFDEVGPRFTERPGGYTRIVKLASTRAGDGAEMAVLEMVGSEFKKKAKKKKVADKEITKKENKKEAKKSPLQKAKK